MRIPTFLLLSGIPALLIGAVALAAWLLLLMLMHHIGGFLTIAAIVLGVAVLAKRYT